MLINNGRNAANNEVSKQYDSEKDALMTNGILHCPVCGATITYSKLQKTVVCEYCLSSIDAEDASYSGEDFVMSIDNPDSATIYVENFFREYDWENYKRSSIIEIPAIKKLVEKQKIISGASASSWILDFYTKIMLINKKFELLDELLVTIVDEFDGKLDTPNAALYERVACVLRDECPKLFKSMSADLDNALKLDADSTVIDAFRTRLDAIEKKYDELVRFFTSIDEIDEVKAAIEAHKANLIEKFNKDGVDVEYIYNEAVDIYENYEDKAEALRLFSAVEGFESSEDYIKEINTFFNFDNLIFKLADKHFLARKVSLTFNPSLFDKKNKKKKNASEEYVQPKSKKERTALSLYEIIGGKAYEPSAVSGVSCPLNFYANKLFYIKRDTSICSYDIVTHKETELDRGFAGDYLFDENSIKQLAFPAPERSCFFIRKKLSPFVEDTRRGCIKTLLSIFKRENRPMPDMMNNYSLLRIDMLDNVATVEIDRLVDVTECYNGRLFYITYENGAPEFKLYDLKTGEKTTVLSEECEIHDVIGDTIIYSTWNPTHYNKSLCAYDLNTSEKTVIEENIYKYFKTIDQRLYYGVGNENYSVLFSNDVTGADRIEITADIVEIVDSLDEWIYVTRRIESENGSSLAIVKVSKDGESKLLIAKDIRSLVKKNDSYIYYTDVLNSLHVVQCDGSCDRVIAIDVARDEDIIIDKDYIYYLRLEAISANEEAYSLYRTNHSGKGTLKLLFHVNGIKNFDAHTLYAYRNSIVKYNATTTGDKELVQSEVRFNITKYFTFDKDTEEVEVLLAMGLPSEKVDVEERGGCFKKKITRTTTYTEANEKAVYRKAGIANVGDVYNEQTSFDDEELD